ncbi:hypothetical protein PP182_05210 [Maribacter sp. PR1]|uniref:Uncharacterized protein n=1 Tax=Maribacter cobaltidurans TaxID=1178778 RepID=A0ABU7IR67_9FLAO|nr:MULTISPECIES: hypothetical protein [Maribacter]MDC6388066.1 hypothetical protein [Maribacter sp. PR1]MEE1975454.1 hypothetical protein [Maribacter cobaltidurans]
MLVVKANRALLKKRRSYSDIRAEYKDLTSKTQLKFKELTPFQQKLIRDRIRKQAKKDNIYNLRVTVLSVILILSVLGYLYGRHMA